MEAHQGDTMSANITIDVDPKYTKSFNLCGISRTFGGIGYEFECRNFGTLANGVLIHPSELKGIIEYAYHKGKSDSQDEVRHALGVNK